MASGDSFLKTLTIEGECDRSCKLRKFREPLVYVRLPASLSRKASGAGKAPTYFVKPRGQSLPPSMGRRKLGTSSPPMNVISRFEEATKSSSLITQMDSRLGQYASQFLSKLWLPFCFAGINAVCYAIEPSTGVLMMMSSTFLLHQMGVAGRGLTAFVIGLALAALLWHGSDVVYILAVHTLYYCAVSMGRGNTQESTKTKRPYTKKSG